MDGDTITTEQIIGCAIEVHRHLGPGLLESVYESALCVELKARSLSFKRQVGIPLYYKGELISEHRPDLIVDDKVIVEIKSIDRLAPIHVAQMLTYLRVTSLRVGLILNFNSQTMKEGTRRVVRNASRVARA
jgi:GxxExxY protein